MTDPLPEYTDHRLRTEPDPEKQAAMIEARMADLRSRKPFTEEQFASERANMGRLAANGQKETQRRQKFDQQDKAEREEELQRIALAAVAELDRQHEALPRGPYLYGHDPNTKEFDPREVGIDGEVDLIALVEAILKAAGDGKEP
jgi:hypothetical protein